jgi:hypothetical protein
MVKKANKINLNIQIQNIFTRISRFFPSHIFFIKCILSLSITLKTTLNITKNKEIDVLNN